MTYIRATSQAQFCFHAWNNNFAIHVIFLSIQHIKLTHVGYSKVNRQTRGEATGAIWTGTDVQLKAEMVRDSQKTVPLLVLFRVHNGRMIKFSN